jgi:hypothetical protein
MRRKLLHVQVTPEYLRNLARRDAPRIKLYGWRPGREDVSRLRASTRDALAYLTLARAWRAAGFPLTAVRRIAGRI